jgi:hypothetical protein
MCLYCLALDQQGQAYRGVALSSTLWRRSAYEPARAEALTLVGPSPPARRLLHPAPKAAARQTIVSPAKETRGRLPPTPGSLLRSAPKAAARQTIISPAKQTRGRLLPTPRSLLQQSPRTTPCPPPSKRPQDRLEVCYRPYGVRGCPPLSLTDHLDHGTIATTCQRPEKLRYGWHKGQRGYAAAGTKARKVALRSAPHTAASQTTVRTAKEARGCLPTPGGLLRLAPHAAARRTIVTINRGTWGCLPPSRHLLHLHLLHQPPSYPLTTKVRPVERPTNLPEREKKKTHP